MSDMWKMAARRSSEFDSSAVAYDRYRPQYPNGIFEDIIELGELGPGAKALEIGAGTGIGTASLVEFGLQVVAIEPSAGMRALGQEKLGDAAQFVEGRFEDWPAGEGVDLIVAFSAWHWVEPETGLNLAAEILPSGGSLAISWTEVVSWGQGNFEDRLAEITGSPWPKRVDHMLGSLEPVKGDTRFGELSERRHRFERELDADFFIALTRTYPGFHSETRDHQFRQVIDNEFGGSITRVEDAVLHLARRV
jgi:SAM-dependent methyltransferase